jgi:hypothetical protein
MNIIKKEEKRCFPFNTQQIVFLYIVIFPFYMLFLYQPLCPVHSISDALIVELAFRISIPFRNPHGGVLRDWPFGEQ